MGTASVCPKDCPAKPLQYCICRVQGQVQLITCYLRHLSRNITACDTFFLSQKHKNVDVFKYTRLHAFVYGVTVNVPSFFFVSAALVGRNVGGENLLFVIMLSEVCNH